VVWLVFNSIGRYGYHDSCEVRGSGDVLCFVFFLLSVGRNIFLVSGSPSPLPLLLFF